MRAVKCRVRKFNDCPEPLPYLSLSITRNGTNYSLLEGLTSYPRVQMLVYHNNDQNFRQLLICRQTAHITTTLVLMYYAHLLEETSLSNACFLSSQSMAARRDQVYTLLNKASSNTNHSTGAVCCFQQQDQVHTQNS